MLDLSIIIVGTNEKDFIIKCLKSIRLSNTKYSIETIVVDNASSDGTSDIVRSIFKEVKLIRNEKKLGYIENNNIVMKQALSRYILMLNADIELQPNTLQYMIEFMDTHLDAAVSACKLIFNDGTLQLTCRKFPTPLIYLARLPHFFRWIKGIKRFAKNKIVSDYLMIDYDHKTTHQVDWLLTAFFLMRRKAIDEIGMLDENLFPPFYLEDVEWCFRAKLNGWKVYYVPEVYSIHYYNRGSVKKFNKLSIIHIFNIFVFFKKHGISMLLKKQDR